MKWISYMYTYILSLLYLHPTPPPPSNTILISYIFALREIWVLYIWGEVIIKRFGQPNMAQLYIEIVTTQRTPFYSFFKTRDILHLYWLNSNILYSFISLQDNSWRNCCVLPTTGHKGFWKPGENYFNWRLLLYKPTGEENCTISWYVFIELFLLFLK